MWRNPVVHRTGWQALSRLGATAVAFCAVTLLVYLSYYAAPNQSPLLRRNRSPFIVDRSLHGYLRYLWRFVRHGDLGNSFYFREPVTTRMFRALPVTLSVLAGGLVLGLLFALVPLLRPRARIDRAVSLFSVAGISVHPVWFSLVLSWLFGAHWHLLPDQGYCGITSASTGCNGVTHWAAHMVLPWIVYGLVTGAYYSLAVRSLLRNELDQEYVRAARGKGLTERRIVRSHVLRNITPQMLALSVTNLGIGLGALVFIETIFGLPGLGNMFRVSLRRNDLPLTAGIVMLAVTTILVLTLVVDLVSLLALPRSSRAQRLATATGTSSVQRELRERPAEL